MRVVNNKPAIPSPAHAAKLQSLLLFDRELVKSLVQELQAHAQRLNGVLPKDGTEAMSGPVRLAAYVKTAMPSAADNIYGMIYVTNETGGATPAFSDGTNWRRVADRAIVS